MSVRRLAPKELQPANFTFSAENLAWAKEQIAKYPPGRQASAVIPILWRVQEQHDGWVSEAAIRAVADLLDMPYIRALEIATFYTMFQLQPVGKKAHVQVCGTTPCRLRGAADIIEVCQSRIHHDPFHLSKDGEFQLGRGRVSRRLRERADGADLEGYLRGFDQGKLRQGAGRLCLRQSSEAGAAERPSVLRAHRWADHAEGNHMTRDPHTGSVKARERRCHEEMALYRSACPDRSHVHFSVAALWAECIAGFKPVVGADLRRMRRRPRLSCSPIADP
jgi:NADH:ubiquinone oxidoreductase subunit E